MICLLTRGPLAKRTAAQDQCAFQMQLEDILPWDPLIVSTHFTLRKYRNPNKNSNKDLAVWPSLYLTFSDSIYKSVHYLNLHF